MSTQTSKSLDDGERPTARRGHSFGFRTGEEDPDAEKAEEKHTVRWEYCWIRIALEVEGGNGVRILKTSKRLKGWVEQKAYVFDAMPASYRVTPGTMGLPVGSTAPGYEVLLPAHVWAACLDDLGGEGWELTSVVPVSADQRISVLQQSQSWAGRHDVQLWVFKRERVDDAVEGDNEEEADSDNRGSAE